MNHLPGVPRALGPVEFDVTSPAFIVGGRSGSTWSPPAPRLSRCLVVADGFGDSAGGERLTRATTRRHNRLWQGG